MCGRCRCLLVLLFLLCAHTCQRKIKKKHFQTLDSYASECTFLLFVCCLSFIVDGICCCCFCVMLRLCISQNPDKRPTAEQLLKNLWVFVYYFINSFLYSCRLCILFFSAPQIVKKAHELNLNVHWAIDFRLLLY
jgi:hypothetical protein